MYVASKNLFKILMMLYNGAETSHKLPEFEFTATGGEAELPNWGTLGAVEVTVTEKDKKSFVMPCRWRFYFASRNIQLNQQYVEKWLIDQMTITFHPLKDLSRSPNKAIFDDSDNKPKDATQPKSDLQQAEEVSSSWKPGESALI